MRFRSNPLKGLLVSLLGLIGLFSQLLAYTPPQVGDSKVDIIEALGTPIGSIELRDKELLLYPQGEVTIKEGIATTVDIMSPSAFAADQKKLAQEQAEWERNREKMEAVRRTEGLATKKEKIASVRFNSLPPEDQATYWRNFQNTYPSVDVTDELAEAMERYQSALAELREKRALQDLEARVVAAEKEASAAKLEAQRLKRQIDDSNRYYGLRYYRDTPRHREYYYRPPTITIHTSSEDGSVHVHKNGNWPHKVINTNPQNDSKQNEHPPHWRDTGWMYKN